MVVRPGRLSDDHCEKDWIWEREVETASVDEVQRLGGAAWERQYRRLREASPFYARKSREPGRGGTCVGHKDLANLPPPTKQELKRAPDARPSGATHAGVRAGP